MFLSLLTLKSGRLKMSISREYPSSSSDFCGARSIIKVFSYSAADRAPQMEYVPKPAGYIALVMH
jgi:hypothetical protein